MKQGGDRLQQALVLEPDQRQPHRRRDTLVITTACNYDDASPAASRRTGSGRTCAKCAARSARDRSLLVAFVWVTRRLRGRRRDLRHNPVDHTPRPHRAGVDVEIVGRLRRFALRALLRLENDFVFVKMPATPIAGSRW